MELQTLRQEEDMEGLRNDKQKADIMENQVDIGPAMTSESSATTARELDISLMNA